MRWSPLSVPVLLVTVGGCNLPDVNDDPLPLCPATPVVGSGAIQFCGRVPKNLIFLSIDTFRKDHIGYYGGTGSFDDDSLTPFLDGIFETGVSLDDHAQCSDWTFGSTTCTLAGRSNIERGHIPRLNGTDENRLPVPEGTEFLASWLGDAGFYSVIVSGNDWLSSNWGNTQGYDEALRPLGGAATVWGTGSRAIRQAIDRGDADRFFLHMHFMEPHASYSPPEKFVIGQENVTPWPEDLTNRDTHYEWRDEWPAMSVEDQDQLEANLRLLYEGEIRSIDDALGDIWKDMEREGYLDDTLVVLWNDHGEQFWEHTKQTHAFSLNAEENDGFVAFWARNIVPQRYTQPTTAIDLVPTVLDLFDIELPNVVTGFPVGSAAADRPRFAETLARLGAINAVQIDGLKMQYQWAQGKVTVFDRNSDPGETTDLFDPEDTRQVEIWTDYLRPQAEAMAPLMVDGEPVPLWPPSLP